MHKSAWDNVRMVPCEGKPLPSDWEMRRCEKRQRERSSDELIADRYAEFEPPPKIIAVDIHHRSFRTQINTTESLYEGYKKWLEEWRK